MRKNVKQQLALRVLSTAALMTMVSSIATAAFADTYDLNTGSVTVETKADGITYVTQKDEKQADGYARNEKNDILHDYQDKTGVTVTSGGEKTSNTITVETAKDQTTDVTLKDVNIEVDTSEAKTGAIEVKGDGNTNLELDGNNTVLVENDWHDEHAAIEKADKYGTGTLTIKDDVNDDGSKKTGTKADTTGKLLAGGYHEASAIGGGGSKGLGDTSNITITGGEITAIAGHNGGAGIGGGGRPDYGAGKNICIEGNAHVTAVAAEGAAIGGGASGGNSITIKDNAVVNAYGAWGSAIGDGGMATCNKNTSNENLPTTITISGNATVHAETSQSGCAIGSGQHGDAGDLTINIEESANVTAISAYNRPAIGNYGGHDDSTTTINITGGTVNAINSFGSDDPAFSYLYDRPYNCCPAIGGTFAIWGSHSNDRNATCNVNINSSTGDTVVNAYTYKKGSGIAIGSEIDTFTYNDITNTYDSASLKIPADGTRYRADGSSYLGERTSAIVNCYKNGTVTKEKLNLPSTKDPYALNHVPSYRHTITGGTLTKVVHNRKYMDENPNIDTSKLKDEDLHDWKLVGKVVEPTLEKEGYADYICSIDKCGQTKHVVLPKLTPEPSEPDTTDPDVPGGNTPDTPNKPDTPKQPDGTTPVPVTPDAPAQDGTAPADTPAADTTATAQKVAQNAKPEAAAPAAAVLPQTGANWLAAVGTALSGMFLLVAGFVLDRKNRRMN